MKLFLPFMQEAVVAEGEQTGQLLAGEQGGEPEPVRLWLANRSAAIRSHIILHT
jgi:hypothetical protein